MNVNPLLADAVAAVALAGAVVIIVSGAATVGLIAVVVLVACGVTVRIDRRRARARVPRRGRSRVR